jgi:hypothetical protein
LNIASVPPSKLDFFFLDAISWHISCNATMLCAITFEEIKKMKLLLWIIQRTVTTLMELMTTRKRDGVLEAHTIRQLIYQ